MLNQRAGLKGQWMKYVKKVIVEDGHSMAQLVHVFQLIHRHQQLFYPARGIFVPYMVNSLARIGLVGNAAAENKKLALDLASECF